MRRLIVVLFLIVMVTYGNTAGATAHAAPLAGPAQGITVQPVSGLGHYTKHMSNRLIREATCRDVKNGLCFGRTSIFTPKDHYIYAWTEWLTDSGIHDFTFDWYGPSGTPVTSITSEISQTMHAYVWSWVSPTYSFPDYGRITDHPGVYYIVVSIDGVPAGLLLFYFKNS